MADPPRTTKKGSGRASLGDVMLLVALTGVGLATCRYAMDAWSGGGASVFRPFAPFENGVTSFAVVVSAAGFVAITLTLIGGWTLVLPLIRLKTQRIGLRRLLRQPGFTACLAAVFGMLAGWGHLVLTIGISRLVDGRLRLPLFVWVRQYVLGDMLVEAGVWVAAVWTFQVLSGRWRAQPDWVDRVGRVLGVVWIVAGMVWAAHRYLSLL
jgi:hypothetical protein